MTPPIFLDESGDILVFCSKEKAQRYVEAIDVANNEYRGYDSEGRLLNLQLSDTGVIEIQLHELQPTHQMELKYILVKFLLEVEQKNIQISQVSLEELVIRMLKYQL